MKRVALITLMVAALAIGGCSQSVDNAPSAKASAKEPSAATTQYTAPADGFELSPSDQAGLAESQCTLEKAMTGKSPTEQQKLQDEIVNEIVASDEAISVADVLAKRGITC